MWMDSNEKRWHQIKFIDHGMKAKLEELPSPCDYVLDVPKEISKEAISTNILGRLGTLKNLS